MLMSEMGIMALNWGVHMAMAFLGSKIAVAAQCEQGFKIEFKFLTHRKDFSLQKCTDFI